MDVKINEATYIYLFITIIDATGKYFNSKLTTAKITMAKQGPIIDSSV